MTLTIHSEGVTNSEKPHCFAHWDIGSHRYCLIQHYRYTGPYHLEVQNDAGQSLLGPLPISFDKILRVNRALRAIVLQRINSIQIECTGDGPRVYFGFAKGIKAIKNFKTRSASVRSDTHKYLEIHLDKSGKILVKYAKNMFCAWSSTTLRGEHQGYCEYGFKIFCKMLKAISVCGDYAHAIFNTRDLQQAVTAKFYARPMMALAQKESKSFAIIRCVIQTNCLQTYKKLKPLNNKYDQANAQQVTYPFYCTINKKTIIDHLINYKILRVIASLFINYEFEFKGINLITDEPIGLKESCDIRSTKRPFVKINYQLDTNDSRASRIFGNIIYERIFIEDKINAFEAVTIDRNGFVSCHKLTQFQKFLRQKVIDDTWFSGIPQLAIEGSNRCPPIDQGVQKTADAYLPTGITQIATSAYKIVKDLVYREKLPFLKLTCSIETNHPLAVKYFHHVRDCRLTILSEDTCKFELKTQSEYTQYQLPYAAEQFLKFVLDTQGLLPGTAYEVAIKQFTPIPKKPHERPYLQVHYILGTNHPEYKKHLDPIERTYYFNRDKLDAGYINHCDSPNRDLSWIEQMVLKLIFGFEVIPDIPINITIIATHDVQPYTKEYELGVLSKCALEAISSSSLTSIID